MAEINETKQSKFSPKKRRWVKPGQVDIELFPNQTAYTVNKMSDNYAKDDIPFCMHSIEATFYASRNLSKSGLQLYLYLTMNADGFQRALSSKHVRECTGMSDKSFYNARDELIKEGFLYFKEKDNKTLFYDVYEFYESPWMNKHWEFYEYNEE